MPNHRAHLLLGLFLLASCGDDLTVDLPDTAKSPVGPVGGRDVTARAATGEQVFFTAGARTVRFDGPARVFTESRYGITNTVLSNTWVRLLPEPFDGVLDGADLAWLEDGVASNNAGVKDVLAYALDYVDGAPDVLDATGLRIGGDASYGETTGGDFNDYLRIDWRCEAEDRVYRWKVEEAGNLDCSGFVRMVYGYRAGIPLSRDDRTGTTLPRNGRDIFAHGPGVIIIDDHGQRPPAAAYARLAPGDLVFFDAKSEEVGLDHAGIFLGIDTAGQYRMVNSRNSMRGPTFRDGAGPDYGESTSPSVLSGSSLYGRSFRAARRL